MGGRDIAFYDARSFQKKKKKAYKVNTFVVHVSPIVICLNSFSNTPMSHIYDTLVRLNVPVNYEKISIILVKQLLRNLTQRHRTRNFGFGVIFRDNFRTEAARDIICGEAEVSL